MIFCFLLFSILNVRWSCRLVVQWSVVSLSMLLRAFSFLWPAKFQVFHFAGQHFSFASVLSAFCFQNFSFLTTVPLSVVQWSCGLAMPSCVPKAIQHVLLMREAKFVFVRQAPFGNWSEFIVFSRTAASTCAPFTPPTILSAWFLAPV